MKNKIKVEFRLVSTTAYLKKLEEKECFWVDDTIHTDVMQFSVIGVHLALIIKSRYPSRERFK